MTELNIIMISGRKRSGKTTVASALADFGYIPLALADTLKYDLAIINPIIGVETTGDQRGDCQPVHLNQAIREYGEDAVKGLYPEYRRLMQQYGTEIRRAEDSKHWVRLLVKRIMRRYEIAVDEGKERCDIVVTDVRFMDEYENINLELGTALHAFNRRKDENAETVYKDLLIAMNRPAISDTGDTHSSETGVLEIQKSGKAVDVLNNGSIEDLIMRIDDVEATFRASKSNHLLGELV